MARGKKKRLQAGARRRMYSTSEREAAVADVAKLSLTVAATKHGMPTSTLCRWAKAAAEEAKVEGEAEGIGVRAPADSAEESRSYVGKVEHAKPASEGIDKRIGNDPAAAKPRPAKKYTPSQRALILETAAKDGPSAAAERHDCSRFAIYDWTRKVARAAAGEDSSPTSGPAQSEVEARRDREILDEWRRHPGLGPSQIRNQLRAKCVKVSVHTVRRVMEDAGYRPPKVQRQPHDERFEAVRPNHMWHLDFVHRHINRASTFTLILIDDHSRYVVGHGVDEVERADMVLATFEEAVRRHGRPEMVMHDKGGAFWSWRGISRFTALLTELGVDQVPAEHKEWNGKVEVFNANLHKELFDVQRFYDVAEMKRRLAAHLHWYNHARTHHALGGLLVPADRYFGRVEEVLARIEAGVPRDGADALELRERCLELFKVTSRNGAPEVWLLGQRLLGAPA